MMTFEDLDAWKQARAMVNGVYNLTRQDRLGRDFGLASQLQRAAVSIMTNIAEGFERVHVPEKMQFYNIARASTGEVRSLLYVVADNFPETAPAVDALRHEIISVGKLTSGLLNATEKRRHPVTKLLSSLLALF